MDFSCDITPFAYCALEAYLGGEEVASGGWFAGVRLQAGATLGAGAKIRLNLEDDAGGSASILLTAIAGVIHTLVCDDRNGMKTVFWLNGSLEFYDDDDNLTDVDQARPNTPGMLAPDGSVT